MCVAPTNFPAFSVASWIFVNMSWYSLLVSSKPEKFPRSVLAASTTSTPGTRAMSCAFATPTGVSIISTTSMFAFTSCR
jgi:hypothetical protein